MDEKFMKPLCLIQPMIFFIMCFLDMAQSMEPPFTGLMQKSKQGSTSTLVLLICELLPSLFFSVLLIIVCTLSFVISFQHGKRQKGSLVNQEIPKRVSAVSFSMTCLWCLTQLFYFMKESGSKNVEFMSEGFVCVWGGGVYVGVKN